jgi:hypothetical protein
MLYSLKYFAVSTGCVYPVSWIGSCHAYVALRWRRTGPLCSWAPRCLHLEARTGWTHCNGATAFLDRSTTLDTILVEGKRESDEAVSCWSGLASPKPGMLSVRPSNCPRQGCVEEPAWGPTLTAATHTALYTTLTLQLSSTTYVVKFLYEAESTITKLKRWTNLVDRARINYVFC